VSGRLLAAPCDPQSCLPRRWRPAVRLGPWPGWSPLIVAAAAEYLSPDPLYGSQAPESVEPTEDHEEQAYPRKQSDRVPRKEAGSLREQASRRCAAKSTVYGGQIRDRRLTGARTSVGSSLLLAGETGAPRQERKNGRSGRPAGPSIAADAGLLGGSGTGSQRDTGLASHAAMRAGLAAGQLPATSGAARGYRVRDRRQRQVTLREGRRV
jgi:hypothetical protein